MASITATPFSGAASTASGCDGVSDIAWMVGRGRMRLKGLTA
jgi:hypothetical protein